MESSPSDVVLPRLAGESVRRALGVSPVVVVMGARQTGKSTLVRSLPALEGYPYLTLDDLDLREAARSSPDDLVRRAPRLILDEVQREADLVLAIKRAVDEQRPRQRGRFVLTGSANLLLMSRVSETLAGRATYVTLWPMTRREQLGLGSAGLWGELFRLPQPGWQDRVLAEDVEPADWRPLARRGGHPTPAHELEGAEERAIWFSGYVKTYLERDLQDLSSIDNLVDFRRLMRALSLRVGNLVNQTELGRDAGLPQSTVHRYLNLLETSYQLVRLESYSVNRTRRLIKRPKAYWSDTGLALHLAGEAEPGGAHLENLVLADLVAWRDAQVTPPEVLYWRTASGQEVDFVVEHGGELLAIEVKTTTRPGHADAAHLASFRDEYRDRFRGGLLLHAGAETFRLSEGILAVPWWRVF
jgi:uncharacterized protein